MQHLLSIGAHLGLVATVAVAMGLLCLLVPIRVGSWLVERGVELGRELQVAASPERERFVEMLENATGGFLMPAPAVAVYVAGTVVREPFKLPGSNGRPCDRFA